MSYRFHIIHLTRMKSYKQPPIQCVYVCFIQWSRINRFISLVSLSLSFYVYFRRVQFSDSSITNLFLALTSTKSQYSLCRCLSFIANSYGRLWFISSVLVALKLYVKRAKKNVCANTCWYLLRCVATIKTHLKYVFTFKNWLISVGATD